MKLKKNVYQLNQSWVQYRVRSEKKPFSSRPPLLKCDYSGACFSRRLHTYTTPKYNSPPFINLPPSQCNDCGVYGFYEYIGFFQLLIMLNHALPVVHEMQIYIQCMYYVQYILYIVYMYV